MDGWGSKPFQFGRIPETLRSSYFGSSEPFKLQMYMRLYLQVNSERDALRALVLKYQRAHKAANKILGAKP